MKLIAGFQKRDFSTELDFPNLEIIVNRFSWSAIGGPEQATATCYGDERSLWELMEWLRSPMAIYDRTDEPLWWGYVHAVTLRIGAIEVGVSLDGMYNRIAVAYSQKDAAETGPGERATASWTEDTDSIGTYGTKELLASLSEATAASAAQYRDALLAQFKYPSSIPRLGSSQGGSLSATITAVGWWNTLAWQYYVNTNSALVATTTQISTIVAAEAPLLAGSNIIDVSGVSTSENQSGDKLAGAIIAQLLKQGTTNDLRLLAKVTKDRYLEIYEEPEYGGTEQSELFLNTKGILQARWGSTWVGLTNPVARWVELLDVPSNLDTNIISDPSHFFVERADFDPQTERWTPEPKGIPSAWDLAPDVEG